MLVERDKLKILVIGGGRTDEHCFRSEVGIGSKLQLVSGELDNSFEISSIVKRAKEEKCGGITGRGM